MELPQFSVSTWLTLIAGFIIFCIVYANKRLQYWKHQGIPSPMNNLWSFIVGIYKFKKKPLHILQMEDYKKCGRIFGMYMGFQPQLVVAEPHILRNVLVKDFNTFHNRMKLVVGDPLFDNMLSVIRDDDWKRVRCIMSPTFTSSRMRKMAYLIRECAEKLEENMKKIVDKNKNQSIDCKIYLNNFSIDVIATTAFGTKMNSLDDPNNEFTNRSRKLMNTDASFSFLFLFLFPKVMRFLRIGPFTGVFDYFRDFALHVIERREKENTKANDFLQLLLDAQKGVLEISPEDTKEDLENEQPEFKLLPKHKTMTTDEMLSQCSLFLFAGNETTTNTLAFVLYYMAMNPECQEKLIREIDQAWNTTKDMNFDVLNKMQYLDAVINETLRKQPIGFQLVRECAEDYEISEINFKIPKGMNVIIPAYAMHYDKEFFPNPEKFDPERFMPENRSSIPDYAYLPFGEGPRNCLGMRFVAMVMKMCLVHLFRDFKIRATEETKKPLEFYTGQGLIQPKKVMVKFERRN